MAGPRGGAGGPRPRGHWVWVPCGAAVGHRLSLRLGASHLWGRDFNSWFVGRADRLKAVLIMFARLCVSVVVCVDEWVCAHARS